LCNTPLLCESSAPQCNLTELIVASPDFLTINGKGGKVRRVPFMPDTKKMIATYINARTDANVAVHKSTNSRSSAGSTRPAPEIPLFIGQRGKRLLAPAFEGRVSKLRKMLLLPETFTPHALRHSCATHLMAESDDLRGVQELLGHASLSTTQIYTDINSEQLRSAVQGAHPRAVCKGAYPRALKK
jgi:integrase/recombinase XerC